MIVAVFFLIQPLAFQGYAGYSIGLENEKIYNSLFGSLNLSKEEDIYSIYTEFRSNYTFPEESLFYSLDRAVVYLFPYPLTIALGKERVNWGFGMFYSPCDFFNPRYSIFDYERLREGVLMMELGYEWKPSVIQEFVAVLPEDEEGNIKDKIRLGSKLNFFLNNYECFLSGVYYDSNLPVSFGIRKDIFDFILYSESSFEHNGDSLHPSFLLGVNRMLGTQGIVNMEYYYNSKGITEWSDSIPFLSSVTPTPGYTGRHYIYFSTELGKEEGFSAGLYSVFHPLWKAGFVGLNVSYNGFENIIIRGTGIKIVKRGEFSLLPFDYLLGMEIRYYY